MADERWISFPQMVGIVRSRYSMSIGRAEKVVKDAIASGEVRRRPEPRSLLVYDDGALDMNLRPGAINKGGVTPDGKLLVQPLRRLYSEDDFLDWLSRQTSLQGKPATKQTKPAELKPVSEVIIKDAITKAYADAERTKAKPPNLNELVKLVQSALKPLSYKASGPQIQEIASAEEFANRRLKTGERFTRSLPSEPSASPQPPLARQPKRRHPGDVPLIEEGKKLVREEGLSYREAARRLAPKAEGSSLDQKEGRLRKLIAEANKANKN